MIVRYNGPDSSGDYAYDIAASPDGTRIFVTGLSSDGEVAAFATVAYDVTSMRQAWVARLDVPGNTNEQAHSVAVSPDGGRVYVGGYTTSRLTNVTHMLIVAYDALTGRRLWVARHQTPTEAVDYGPWLGVDPGGGRLYATGSIAGQVGGRDFLTLAYATADGSPIWESTYTGPGEDYDDARAIGISPDGGRVYVTGPSYGIGTYADAATIAYSAATGDQLWATRFDGPDHFSDVPYDLGVSPDGKAVYVTGDSYGRAGTLAYDASTGDIVWTALHDGPPFGGASARALAVAPDGASVFVTGTIGIDYGTIAYDARTGTQRWVAEYNGIGNRDDDPHDIGISKDGTRLYVTGASIGLSGLYDYATVAYAATDGRQLEVNRYNGPRNRSDEALALAVNPVNGDVYVTGYSDISAAANDDYVTIGYHVGREATSS